MLLTQAVLEQLRRKAVIPAAKEKHSTCLLTELLRLHPLGEKIFLLYNVCVYLSQILRGCKKYRRLLCTIQYLY